MRALTDSRCLYAKCYLIAGDDRGDGSQREVLFSHAPVLSYHTLAVLTKSGTHKGINGLAVFIKD